MSRTARVVTGSVLAAVLLVVAVAAGVLSAAAGGAGAFDPDGFFAEDLSGSAEGEVLDVDDDWGWPMVDVRFTTDEDEVVVTSVDWEWGALPDVGDVVGIAYDPADPEWAYAADDPYVRGVAVEADEEAADGAAAGAGPDEELARVAGWVSLGALLGIVVVALGTVVAVVRAPAPVRVPYAGQYAGQHVGQYAGQYAGQHAGQYAGQHAEQQVPGQPYQGGQPYPVVDRAPTGGRGDWSSPG